MTDAPFPLRDACARVLPAALVLAALLPGAAAACRVAWDPPPDGAWLEGIRIYRDGAPVGTAPVNPPQAECTAVAVVPCVACVYTATFYRGAQEGPQSLPLVLEIAIPGGGRVILDAR